MSWLLSLPRRAVRKVKRRYTLWRVGADKNGHYPYGAPSLPSALLTPAHFAPVTLPAPQRAFASGPLRAIADRIPDAFKWDHYFQVYEEIFRPYRGKTLRILEIGIYKGGSLKMWRDYFGGDTMVAGIDINPDCAAFEDAGNNIFVRIGDQSDAAFLNRVVAELGPFDIIIDDGSHTNVLTIASFNHLFLEGVRSPGLYVVEDTHASFFLPFRDQKHSIVDLAKDLVDIMHHHYLGRLPWHFNTQDERRVPSVEIPRIAAELEEIRFLDSLIVFAKRTRTFLPSHDIF